MRNLILCNVEQADELAWPQGYKEITLQSSALLALTDFKEHKPLVIRDNIIAHQAEHLMMNAHVRLKMVVDENNGFLGIVSLNDISHQEIMKKVANGFNHDDLLVTDFMRSKTTLKAIEFKDLETANVGDLLHTLKMNGERHCLVIDRSMHHIRGVVSASDLVKMLKLPFDLNMPPSFLEIFNAVHG